MNQKAKNKHGRVGVKRTRPTTNQALRQRLRELERANGLCLDDVLVGPLEPRNDELLVSVSFVEKLLGMRRAKDIHDALREEFF